MAWSQNARQVFPHHWKRAESANIEASVSKSWKPSHYTVMSHRDLTWNCPNAELPTFPPNLVLLEDSSSIAGITSYPITYASVRWRLKMLLFQTDGITDRGHFWLLE